MTKQMTICYSLAMNVSVLRPNWARLVASWAGIWVACSMRWRDSAVYLIDCKLMFSHTHSARMAKNVNLVPVDVNANLLGWCSIVTAG